MSLHVTCKRYCMVLQVQSDKPPDDSITSASAPVEAESLAARHDPSARENSPIEPWHNQHPADKNCSVDICCNAVYGSVDGADSPTGSMHSMIPMSGVKLQPMEDMKENLSPADVAPHACLMRQFGSVQSHMHASCVAAALPDQAACKGPGLQGKATYSSPIMKQPLQPLQVGNGCSGTVASEVTPSLLPLPAVSALTQLPRQLPEHLSSHRLCQLSSQQLSHQASSQAPADVCLFGSPPHNQHDTQTDRPSALEGLVDNNSELEFMELLAAAQQQRVSCSYLCAMLSVF